MEVAEFAPAIVPKFSGNHAAVTHGSDAALHVEFFVEDVYQEFESEKQGRAIYKPVEKVRITFPGAKSDIIKHVQYQDLSDMPSHPNRFPRQWAAFKAQQAQTPEGTPLEMCKFIASHRVKELKAQNVYTAEQLANLPDTILQTLGMGASRERDLAKAFLNEDTKLSELSAALASKKAMEHDMAALRAQLADLSAKVQTTFEAKGVMHEDIIPLEPVRRGPGRPRRETEE